MPTQSETIAVCRVKRRAETASKGVEAAIMKDGRPATRYVCVECRATKFRTGMFP